MKTVIRHDRATLRKPSKTSQGFLRVDGYIGRVGIYEYRNDDGTIRRELRPREEVLAPAALESADAASLTIGHPREDVTAENVREHEVGAVTGKAWADGDHAAASFVVKDKTAINQIERGKKELSPGYRIDLDETPGADPRYGYPGNPQGRYDAVQRKIRVNHVALVERARGGSSVALRLDEAERVDGCGKMTTSFAGHQHLIDLDPQYGDRYSGSTSWATAEGSEQSHDHPWVRNPDGSITIGESAGHTHEIIDENHYGVAAYVPTPVPGSGAEIDRLRPRADSGGMDPQEQIRSLKEQLAAAEAKRAQHETAANANAARADSADARVVTLTAEINDLRAQIAAAATEVETRAIARERARADEAEAKIRRFDAEFAARISKRADLERRISVVMGPEFNPSGIPDRQLMATAVKRLDAQADTSSRVSDAFLEGRFEALLDLHARNARSSQRVADVIGVEQQRRADEATSKITEIRNQWQKPFPNSREGQKGA